MEEANINDTGKTSIPYKKSKEISRLQDKQAENAGGQSGQVPIIAVPQVQPKPRGSVLDAAASSYLPRGNIADCKSTKKGRDKVPG